MYRLIQPLLFLMPPEKAHHFTTRLFHLLLGIPGVRLIIRSTFTVTDPRLERELFGLRFPNPVGLAAGFDKNATLYNDFRHLGFGFIEVGTVTPRPQPGNPQPRMFRLKKDGALINRMGFNNEGVVRMVEQLKKRQPGLIVGGNIGKNKNTPQEKSVEDFSACFEALFPHVDYFTVNVSSPNTPGLRDLQGKEPLLELLNTLQQQNKARSAPKPILLKIAPDLEMEALNDIVDIVKETDIDGVIATNTTIARKNLQSCEKLVNQQGGLSGKPVTSRSTAVIRHLATRSEGAFPIIGVGGIHSAKDALEKLEAGASLVQIYTGFIYEGPKLIKSINKALLKAQV